ncbi:MAG: hypothetical protein HYV63_12565 [Candidatus Schekmanbacteria bacterium]|nr:hypothetical protein [Candidatus Schekmanbacteria bacterium]
MARFIPEDVSITDVATLADEVIACLDHHGQVLDCFVAPKIGPNWQLRLKALRGSLEQAIADVVTEAVALDGGEAPAATTELTRWKRHVLSVAQIAFEEHPHREKLLRDLGRGVVLDVSTPRLAADYLVAVLPHVRLHREALLAAGAEARDLDRAAVWLAELGAAEGAGEHEPERRAVIAAADRARHDLIQALNWVIAAANAAAYHHAAAETAISSALTRGHQALHARKRAADPALAAG